MSTSFPVDSIYSLSSTSQLMENHLPAGIFASGEALAGFEDSSNNTMVLTIGTDSILRAVTENTTQQIGWEAQDISTDPALNTQIQSLFGATATYTTISFAASMNAGGTALTVIATFEVTPDATASSATTQVVFELSGNPGIAPSAWLLQAAQRTWTPLPFDATGTAITPQTLIVEQLVLETLPSGTPVYAALVNNPANQGELMTFAVSPGSTPAWTQIDQEQDMTSLIAAVAGTTPLKAQPAGGLFKLYENSGVYSLTFAYQPFDGYVLPALILTAPDAPTAADAVTFSLNSVTTTALFIAGTTTGDATTGTISLYLSPFTKDQSSIALPPSALFLGMTQIHAVIAGDTVIVWGVNNAQQLVQLSCLVADIGDVTQWSIPMPLLSGITNAGAIVGASEMGYGVVAVGLLPAGAVASALPNAQGPMILQLNETTGFWTNTVLPAPSTTDCVTLKTYTARVQVTEKLMPAANASLTIVADQSCSLIVNGAATWFTALSPLAIPLDGSGSLNLIFPTPSLSGPLLIFSAPDGSSLPLDTSAAMALQLSQTTADSLNATTFVNSAGQTQNLVNPANAANVPDAVSGITTLTTVAQSAKRASVVKAGRKRVRPMRTNTVKTSLGDGVLTDLGDLVQWVEAGIEDLGNVIIEAGVLVVTIAGEIFTAVIECAEDAMHALSIIFAEIGAIFEDIFRALAFLFQIKEMVAVGQFLATMFTTYLDQLPANIGNINTLMQTKLTSLQQSLNPASITAPFSGVTGSDPSSTYNSQGAPTPQVGGTNVSSDSRVGWMNDRMQNAGSAAPPTSASTKKTAAIGDDPIDAAFTEFATSIGDLAEDIASDIGDAVAGTMTSQQLLNAVATSIATTALTDLGALCSSATSALASSASATNIAINANLDVPVLSGLYSMITGESLTWLNLVCLLQGAAITIVYGIATGNSAADALSSYDPITVASSYFAAINPSATGLAATESTLADDSAWIELLQYFTGSQMMLQSIFSMVIGSSEILYAANNYLNEECEYIACRLYYFDLVNRALRSILESAYALVSSAPAKVIVSVGIATLGLAVLGTVYIGLGDFNPEQAQKIQMVDAVLSLLWGSLEMAEACGESFNEAGDSYLEAVAEWVELPSLLASEYLPKGNDIDGIAAAYVIVALRAIALFAAGGFRMGNASPSSDATRSRQHRLIGAAAIA